MAVDGRADTTTSQLCAIDLKLDTLTTDNDKRYDVLEKKEDTIWSAITETKAGVDEVRDVFTNQIQENIRLVSSFSGKDLTFIERVLTMNLKSFNGSLRQRAQKLDRKVKCQHHLRQHC